MDSDVKMQDRAVASLLVALLVLSLFGNALGDLVFLATFGGVYVAIALATLLRVRRFRPWMVGVLGLLAILAILRGGGLFVNEYGQEKLDRLLVFIPMFMFCYPAMLEEEKLAKLFLKYFRYVSMGVCVLTLATFQISLGRVNVLEDNPVWMARACGILAVLSSVSIVREKGWRNVEGVISIMVSMIAVVTTGSRGALVAAVVALTCVVMALRPKRTTLVYILAIAMFVALTYFAGVTLFSDRFQIASVHDRIQADDNARVKLWQDYSEIIYDDPFALRLGFGHDYDVRYKYPHNLVLEVSAECGVIAGLILAIILGIGVVRAYRLMSRERLHVTAFSALYLFSLINCMLSGDMTSPRVLLFTLPLVLSYSRDDHRA